MRVGHKSKTLTICLPFRKNYRRINLVPMRIRVVQIKFPFPSWSCGLWLESSAKLPIQRKWSVWCPLWFWWLEMMPKPCDLPSYMSKKMYGCSSRASSKATTTGTKENKIICNLKLKYNGNIDQEMSFWRIKVTTQVRTKVFFLWGFWSSSCQPFRRTQ